MNMLRVCIVALCATVTLATIPFYELESLIQNNSRHRRLNDEVRYVRTDLKRKHYYDQQQYLKKQHEEKMLRQRREAVRKRQIEADKRISRNKILAIQEKAQQQKAREEQRIRKQKAQEAKRIRKKNIQEANRKAHEAYIAQQINKYKTRIRTTNMKVNSLAHKHHKETQQHRYVYENECHRLAQEALREANRVEKARGYYADGMPGISNSIYGKTAVGINPHVNQPSYYVGSESQIPPPPPRQPSPSRSSSHSTRKAGGFGTISLDKAFKMYEEEYYEKKIFNPYNFEELTNFLESKQMKLHNIQTTKEIKQKLQEKRNNKLDAAIASYSKAYPNEKYITAERVTRFLKEREGWKFVGGAYKSIKARLNKTRK